MIPKRITLSRRSGSTLLRIAQVAPLYESVPPKLYGGTERIVSYLTEELVQNGHDVTLFASGDSQSSARLRPGSERALRLDAECKDPIARHLTMLEQVAREASEFDLIHYHVDYLHFPVTRRTPQRHLTTLHGRLDLPELAPLYREYWDMPLVSISDSNASRSAGRTGWERSSTACRRPCTRSRRSPAPTWPSWVECRPKKDAIRRSKSRAAPACRSRLPPRSATTRIGSISSRSSVRGCRAPASSFSGKYRSRKKARSWAVPARFCSRSPGPSPSDS